jgi:hypothetical protein
MFLSNYPPSEDAKFETVKAVANTSIYLSIYHQSKNKKIKIKTQVSSSNVTVFSFIARSMRILHYAAIIANVSQQQSGQTSLGHPLEFQSGNSKDKTVITNPERERGREGEGEGERDVHHLGRLDYLQHSEL